MKYLVPLLLAALHLLPGCGEEDERPQTAEFITTTILAPTCGRAGCHSAATAWSGFAFDTVDNAREAFRTVVAVGNPDLSILYQVISGEAEPMPPEGPLPRADIALIRAWIASGAEGLNR